MVKIHSFFSLLQLRNSWGSGFTAVTPTKFTVILVLRSYFHCFTALSASNGTNSLGFSIDFLIFGRSWNLKKKKKKKLFYVHPFFHRVSCIKWYRQIHCRINCLFGLFLPTVRLFAQIMFIRKSKLVE